ncbi:hypothetical protein Afil01_09630 [Actinorhabdospora filicis]|uniref:Uncharacterized protein n=1 Tax=Actinorhabdospora filicis TaxID=1785913 RepID=A0A9W6SII7_9ACTN|nr:hypothetical protein Afil01_09630 [Actinorhabdospora filicis]
MSCMRTGGSAGWAGELFSEARQDETGPEQEELKASEGVSPGRLAVSTTPAAPDSSNDLPSQIPRSRTACPSADPTGPILPTGSASPAGLSLSDRGEGRVDM